MKKKIIVGDYEVIVKDPGNATDEELKKIALDAIKKTKSAKPKDEAELRLFTKEGKLVEKGDATKTFRGENAIVTGWRLPSHPGSTGRVYVKLEGEDFESEFFPSVCGMEWKPIDHGEAELEDVSVKDIPVNAPEEEINITYTEQLKGGKNALTYSMVETAFKDRAKDGGKTFKAYVDAVEDSLKDDIANAEFIVSGEMKPTRKLLLEDYVKIEKLIEKAGMADKLAEFKPLVDELSEKLNLDYWKQPKFKKSMRKKASQELRGKHRWDSKITKTMKPVFLCTKTELTKSYKDAKQGKLPQVFEANLEKVRKDMAADYDRINQGRDTYVEDPRIAKTLPEIIDLYETAREYADDLEYSEYAQEFDYMLDTIKKGWGLAGI